VLKIRRLENKSGHFMRHPEGDRDAGPERGAHQNDAIAIIASRVRFAIGGFTVLQANRSSLHSRARCRENISAEARLDDKCIN
jgi:hypothetical protein